LRKDSLESISCGVRLAAATATAFAPVSSAILRRAEETAGAEAPRSGMNPNAAVIHAIVLAVPITPHVPAYGVLENRSRHFARWRAYSGC
jgi:hypothetical protein